jgi:hypothetical protein
VSTVTTLRRVVLMTAVTVLVASSSDAQSLQVRGFFDAGVTTFTASQSFTAVLGSSSGSIVGGGGGVVLPANVFVDVHASRFRKNGRRVFVSDGDVFALGIANTITVTPLEVTAGYRFARRPARLPQRGRGPVRRPSVQRFIPYIGGGIGWYRYQETDQFAQSGDAVDKRVTGYHVTGGVDVPILKWLAVAPEIAWASVPNALGQDPNSVSAAYGETNLGGITVRLKVVVGR